jgi:hypothetical protein
MKTFSAVIQEGLDSKAVSSCDICVCVCINLLLLLKWASTFSLDFVDLVGMHCLRPFLVCL